MIDMEYIIRKIRNRTPQPIDIKQEYSVTIPLIKVKDSWHIIYEVRAKGLKRQPGEISFPGGKVEKGETYREAAIRETVEELNINKENINLVGELDYLVSRDNTIIHSFLAIIENVNLEDIKPNKSEVECIFTVPMDFFLENEPELYYVEFNPVFSSHFPYNLIPNGKDYNWRISKYSVYFYNYNGYIIWGYTAKMTKNFMDIIKG